MTQDQHEAADGHSSDDGETGESALAEQQQRLEQAKESGQPALDGTPVEDLERERRERLDPDNRPDNAEVDNTDRDFDVEKGMFADNPEYERAEKRFPPLGDGGA